DLVAPGNLVISTLDKSESLYGAYPGNEVVRSYFTTLPADNWSKIFYRLSGTSMATPVVSGAAALLIQQNPSMTPDQVKARLMKTATKNFPVSSVATDPTTGISYTSYYDLFTIGAGYVDVWAALNSTDLATGSAKSPVTTYNSVSGTVSLVFDLN